MSSRFEMSPLRCGMAPCCVPTSTGRPVAVKPPGPHEFMIRLRPTDVLLGPDHRLQLNVSSSDFPNFDRNHNTGKDFWSDAELQVAWQTVMHDSEHPSRLVLPVIED